MSENKLPLNISQSNQCDTLEKTMRDIEQKTEAKVILAYAKKDVTLNVVDPKENSHSLKTLVSIMSEGNEEFEKRTGRPMTYSEMRAMYG